MAVKTFSSKKNCMIIHLGQKVKLVSMSGHLIQKLDFLKCGSFRPYSLFKCFLLFLWCWVITTYSAIPPSVHPSKILQCFWRDSMFWWFSFVCIFCLKILLVILLIIRWNIIYQLFTWIFIVERLLNELELRRQKIIRDLTDS